MDMINAKFANMRKEEEFTVYPKGDTDTQIQLQSDHRCAIIDIATGKGVVSKYVAAYPRFVHCQFDAFPIQVDQNFVARCLALQPQKGDKLLGGILVIG